MAGKNFTVPAVYIILERVNEVLLSRRFQTGYQDGNYNLPAGHVDEGELPLAALLREVKEEIGVELILEDVRFVHTMYRAKADMTGQRADYFFTTTKWKGEPKNLEPDKCDDVRWFTYDNLPEKMTPHVRLALENAKRGIAFSELPIEYFKENGYNVSC